MPSVDDIHMALGRIEGKVEMLLDQGKIQDDRHNALDMRFDVRSNKLEDRIRNVEQRQHWYAGAVAVAATVGTYITQHWQWKS